VAADESAADVSSAAHRSAAACVVFLTVGAISLTVLLRARRYRISARRVARGPKSGIPLSMA
jgi:hypothetical protein